MVEAVETIYFILLVNDMHAFIDREGKKMPLKLQQTFHGWLSNYLYKSYHNNKQLLKYSTFSYGKRTWRWQNPYLRN